LSRKQIHIFLFLSAVITLLLVFLGREDLPQGDLDWPKVEDVTGLRIDNDQGVLVASRRGGEWTVSQPERGIGKKEALEDLILMGARIRIKAQFPNGERSHYGLNPPAARLELRGGDAGTQIAFGKKAPAHYASYIQVDNGPVLAVVGYPIETVNQAFDAFYAAE
jgi:hypothetical protein